MAKAEVGTKELKMKYDARGDVLYLSVGDAREAISLEVEDGVILRSDPFTDEVVGITVIDMSKRFTDHPDKVLSLPFSQLHLVAQT
jgi:uncharacterized protein YuzE